MNNKVTKSENMKSIVIILPYFGKLPYYFDFWLASCRNNPTIDWLIFTDCDASKLQTSSNIKIINISFDDFINKIQDFFPFKISVTKPYKLCDFKVVYGLFLNEYVNKYDFWGYCDCDLIFGNIRKFATDEILSKCDKFLGHGHFSLQRNNDPNYWSIIETTKTLALYDYKYVYSHEQIFAFDEYDKLGISHTYLKFHSDRFYSGYTENGRVYDDIFSDITHFRDIVKDGKKSKKIVLYTYENGQLERIICENKMIYTEETLYVHFMKRPMDKFTDNTEQYCIVPDKFVTYNAAPDLNYMFFNGGQKFIDTRDIKAKISRVRAAIKIGTRYRNIKTKLKF
jgi:hypothetical protein